MSGIRAWNRCDTCGKFIAYEDFRQGYAARWMTEGPPWDEKYETYCKDHAVWHEKLAK